MPSLLWEYLSYIDVLMRDLELEPRRGGTWEVQAASRYRGVVEEWLKSQEELRGEEKKTI